MSSASLTAPLPGLQRLWPLPALLAWGLAWAAFLALRGSTAPLWTAVAAGLMVGASFALTGTTPTRRLLLAGGFPVSLLASGLVVLPIGLPGWAWLSALAVLLALYPLKTWRDAPLFPTPAAALDGLAELAPLPPAARVIDAGCGLGHGLAALRRAYPLALLDGVEHSAPIAVAAWWRCRRQGLRARIRRGDMWAADWRGASMVYLFQRPESLPRAVAKAQAELAPGAWLASLEFEAAGLTPRAVLRCPDGRPLWLYRMPFADGAQVPRPRRR